LACYQLLVNTIQVVRILIGNKAEIFSQSEGQGCIYGKIHLPGERISVSVIWGKIHIQRGMRKTGEIRKKKRSWKDKEKIEYKRRK
jgi:hypothetical protein